MADRLQALLEELDTVRFARLQGALEPVLDLPPEEAEAALDRSLEGDPELRALAGAILEADSKLLAPGRTAERFLSRSMLADIAKWPPHDEGADADLLGSRAGPYRIVREIGRGGMGSVYLAERADGQFEQTVAIKVLRRGLDTDEVLRRFLRERQILASLVHPHIARLLDGGATQDGRPFLAMERVEGEPITEWCDARSATLDRRLDLFLTVCAAVEHAHRHLVVHRDLKPGNILVTSDGSAKLLDFGVAQILTPENPLGPEGSGAERLTGREGLPLTPAYAAPEQLRGEAATTGTDVYGLGMVLHELLVGCLPFQRKGRTLEAIRREAAEQDVADPSRALTRRAGGGAAADSIEATARRRSTSPERLRRALAGDLDAIAVTALAADPGRRYGSVEALVRDLQRYRANLPVRARRPSRLYRIRKLVRRHRAAVAAGVAVLGLLLAYAVTTAVMLDRQRRERLRAETEARRAERIQEFMTDMLARAGPQRLGEGTEQLGSANPDVTIREALDGAAARAEKELADDPPVLAGVERAIGETYFALGVYDRAEAHVRASARAWERLGDAQGQIESFGLLAQVLQRRTRYDEALQAAHRSRELARATFGGASAEVAMGLQNEQAILGSLGRTEEAGDLLAEAVRIGRTTFAPNDPRFIEILNSAAVQTARLGRYAAADSLYRDVLARARLVYGGDHPRTALAMMNLATNLSELKRYDEAEPLQREVLALRRRSLGPDHPAVATALSNLGMTLRERGRFGEAESVLNEALALRERVLGADNRETLVTRSVLANLLLKEGKPKEAESLHRAVLADRRRVLGADHPLVASSLVSLADALVAQKRVREAIPLLREAVELRVRVLPEGHPDIAKARARLAAAEAGEKGVGPKAGPPGR